MGAGELTTVTKSQPRFAIVGTGTMAATMMSTFRRAGSPVNAVFSRDARRAREFAERFAIPAAATDLGDFLRSSEFDAVYIANASADHAATAIAALEAGKAVLCEKPLALSIDDAEKVAGTAMRTGTLCMEALWIPFLPAYRRFLALARAQACGTPQHLFADFGYPVNYDSNRGPASPAAAGVLLDRGVYLVALALDLFGPVEDVDAQIDFTEQELDRQAALLLRHQDGGQSQLAASFSTLMSNSASLSCSQGMIRLEEPLLGAEAVSLRHMAAIDGSARTNLHERTIKRRLTNALRERPLLRRLKRAMPKARREHLPYGPDPYLPQLRHFLELMASNAKESDTIPLELSLNIQRVIALARASHNR